jgi:hypothetical protein
MNQQTGLWVWVPYTCFLHLYDASEISTCAKEKDMRWLVGFGDSQMRETFAMLRRHQHLPPDGDFVRSVCAAVESLVTRCNHGCVVMQRRLRRQ